MAYESYADEIYYKNVYGGDAIADEFLNKAQPADILIPLPTTGLQAGVFFR